MVRPRRGDQAAPPPPVACASAPAPSVDAPNISAVRRPPPSAASSGRPAFPAASAPARSASSASDSQVLSMEVQEGTKRRGKQKKPPLLKQFRSPMVPMAVKSLGIKLIRGAIVGDEFYFTLRWGNAIVKYDWRNNCLSMINPPSSNTNDIALMEMEDNALGFACIEGSSLYLWSRNVKAEGSEEWMQCRHIELDGVIPVSNPNDEAFVVGSAEGLGVIFVTTGAGRVRKVAKPHVYFSVLPYMSFYTPEYRVKHR
ncbi:hypothetical protein EJB05_14340, partial [Eragrostis curvula]